MQEGLMITLLSLMGTLVFGAFFIVLLTLFPKLVIGTSEAAKRMHGRAVLLGFINLVFVVVIAVALNAIGEGSSIPFLQVLALILLSVLLVGLGFGLAGMAFLLGEQILPERSHVRQMAVGAVILWFSNLTPYLGWFLLLPYLCLRGLGGLFLVIFRRKDIEVEASISVES